MKQLKLLFIAFTLLTTQIFADVPSVSPGQAIETAVFNIVSGKVTVERGSSTLTAYQGTRLLQGDTIKTGKKGLAKIYFFNGSSLHLESNTTLSLNTGDRKKEVNIDLKSGNIWAHVKKKTRMKVDTDLGSTEVPASRKTTNFNLAKTNGEVKVHVAKGDLSVTKEGQTESVSAGKKAELSKNKITFSKASKSVKPPSVSQLSVLTTSIIDKPVHKKPFKINLFVRKGRNLISDQASITFSSRESGLTLSDSAFSDSWSQSKTITIKNGQGTLYAKGVAKDAATFYTIDSSSSDGVVVEKIDTVVSPITTRKKLSHQICQKDSDVCYDIEVLFNKK